MTGAPAASAADRILYACLDKGLNFKTTMGSVITLTPPLITTIEQMDRAIDILDETIGAVENA